MFFGRQPNKSDNKKFYTLLEIERDVDQATIKKSYRRLAMKWHPDKNPNNKYVFNSFYLYIYVIYFKTVFSALWLFLYPVHMVNPVYQIY